MSKRGTTGLTLMSTAIAVTLAGAAGAAERVVAPPPSILLVTLDTTRADRLGCYGDAAAVTPHLDALAREGIRFETVTSPAPLTLPSHASILTGRVPRRHGVRANAPFRLPEDVEGLAGLLRRRGYRTAAFVSSAVLDRITGLDSGFDIYDDTVRVGPREAFDHRERAASQTNEAVARRLGEIEAPFFLWVHYYDPHLPYVPPAGFRELFPDDPYRGEIAFVDDQLGRLLTLVRARGGPLLVAIAGDHGESLGEHGEASHGVFLYESTQRVPLLLAGPGLPAGRVVRQRVGLIDLAPTLLDLVGIPAPDGLDGRSLGALIRGEPVVPRAYEMESLFPALAYGWTPLRGRVDDGIKLVLGLRAELYRLETDPGETHDLAAAEPERAARAERELRAWVAQDDVVAMAQDPEQAEQRRRLESLGYVAGGTSIAGGDPVDPREGIVWLDDLEAGRRAYQTGRPEDGIEPLRRLLARNPHNVAAMMTLGRCYLGVGDARRAVEVVRPAVALRPADALTHFSLANALAMLAATLPAAREETRDHYEQALELDPRFADAYADYASFLDASGARREIGPLLERARRAGVQDPEIEIRLAAVELEAGRTDAAREALERSLTLDPSSERALEALAAICDRQGREAEAVELYRRLLELAPDHPRAGDWQRRIARPGPGD